MPPNSKIHLFFCEDLPLRLWKADTLEILFEKIKNRIVTKK